MHPLKKHIPNFLSILRLILIGPFIIALLRDRLWELAGITALIIISDYFDGYLARAWNTITEAGKILDPLADKVCSAAAGIAMFYLRGFPLWLLILIVARDVLILLAGLLLIEFRHFVPASSVLGKAAMVLMTACMVIYLFDIQPLKTLSAIAAAAVICASTVSYAVFFLRAFRESRA